jgi:hypothetical protein
MVPQFYPYAIDSKERDYLAFAFAAFAIMAGYISNALLSLLHVDSLLPLWLLSVPSPLGFYWIFFKLFDRFLWRCRVWKKLGLIRTPDLNGHYEGSFKSSYDNFVADRFCKLEIEQTWTRISVRATFDRSSSTNLVSGMSVVGPVSRLSYQYQNEPSVHASSSMHPHVGTIWLDIQEQDQDTTVLKGEYYTGRGRGTTGLLEVRKARK